MFAPEIILMRFRGDICNVNDPLDEPDDEGNEPNLEKYDVAHRVGFDYIQSEEHYWGFRLWRHFGPSWMKFPLNPSNKREWSIIRKARDWVDRRDHYNRHVKELEMAMAQGHTRILIQPKHISEYASYFLRINEYSHYYALNYGVTAAVVAWRHPKWWWLYLPLLYISMSNAYVHSRYCRTDRFNPYRMIELEALYDQVEFEPESEYVGEGYMCPDTYPRAYWILKREGRVRWTILYLRNQCAAIFSALFIAWRMGHVEEELVGPTHRIMDIKYPAVNTGDYLLPAFLDFRGWPELLPSDIPRFPLFQRIGITADQVFFFGLFAWYVWDRVDALLPRNRPRPKTHKTSLAENPIP